MKANLTCTSPPWSHSAAWRTLRQRMKASKNIATAMVVEAKCQSWSLTLFEPPREATVSVASGSEQRDGPAEVHLCQYTLSIDGSRARSKKHRSTRCCPHMCSCRGPCGTLQLVYSLRVMALQLGSPLFREDVLRLVEEYASLAT